MSNFNYVCLEYLTDQLLVSYIKLHCNDECLLEIILNAFKLENGEQITDITEA